MMKRLIVLTGIALLVMMVGIARADLILDDPSIYSDPSTIHVNDGTTYLFPGPEVHALTNPSSINLLSPKVTIKDVFLVFAVPGDSDSLATNVSVGTVSNITGSQSGLNLSGDLTKGLDVYNNIIPGLTKYHPDGSQSFANYTLFADQGATNFDIWQFDLTTSNPLVKSSPLSVSFSNGVPDGTYVFAYGFGDDNKLYVTPFTETGLEHKVPEPGTLVLLGMGLLGLALYGRRTFTCMKG